MNDRDTGAGGGCESNATAGIIVTTRQRVRAILLLFTPSSWLIAGPVPVAGLLTFVKVLAMSTNPKLLLPCWHCSDRTRSRLSSRYVDTGNLRVHRAGKVLIGEVALGIRRRDRVTLVWEPRCSATEIPGDHSGTVDTQRLIERHVGDVPGHHQQRNQLQQPALAYQGPYPTPQLRRSMPNCAAKRTRLSLARVGCMSKRSS